MRLMIVGSDKVYAIENFYVRYLPENGVEVAQFPAQSKFYDHYQKNIFHKLLFKAGLSRILVSVNREFRAMVRDFRPELIWVFKGMEIFPSSLRWAKEQGIKLVNYNPDNPFIFSGKGSGNRYVIQSLPLYDLHLTYNLEVQKRLEQEYPVKTALLPFGFDLDPRLFEECAQQEEVLRLCFLGNPDEQRAAFIEGLAAAGIPIDVYGNNWSDFVRNPAVGVFPPVYQPEFWRVLRRYRVQLNLMRIHNEDSHNMRSFEIPGVGGVMLAPATTEHRMFFQNNEEVFLFSGLSDAIDQAEALLRMGPQRVTEVRRRARQRSISDGYTYRDRARAVAYEMQKLHA
jgi:spore maturation protein CgeB